MSAVLQERSSPWQKRREGGRGGQAGKHTPLHTAASTESTRPLRCAHCLGSPRPQLTTVCASLCRDLNSTSCYDEALDVMELLDACVAMVVTFKSEERAQQCRSHHLPVLRGCLSAINSCPGQGPTSQPTGSIWRHDLIVVLH